VVDGEEPWEDDDAGFLVRPVDELPGFTDDEDDPLVLLDAEDDGDEEPVEPLGLFCGVCVVDGLLDPEPPEPPCPVVEWGLEGLWDLVVDAEWPPVEDDDGLVLPVDEPEECDDP